MADERDLVVFEDGEGNELTMEVLDYFFYEGKEYAILTEYVEDEGEEEHNERDAYVMQVVPVGEDEEEFIPVEDALAEKLIELVESGAYDADDELEDELD